MYQSTVSYLVAGVGFEPHDLRVMRSSIDADLAFDVFDRTGAIIEKPAFSP